MRWTIALLSAACATSSGPDAAAAGDPSAPGPDAVATADTGRDPACADLTWETAGAPVALTWCAPCHGSGLAPADRADAPVDVDLDSAAGVLAWADRVLARATGPEPDMPPAGGPTEAARARLAAWILCEVDYD